jgi:hypothetical protein
LQGNGFYGAAQNPPAGATVTVLDGSTPLGSAVVNPTGGWSMPVQLDAGPHTLTATQSLAGETSAPSPPFTLTVEVTLQGVEALLLSDHVTLGDLIELEARVLAAELQLHLGRTTDACQSLATFVQETFGDTLEHNAALTIAQAEALVADVNAIQQQEGCHAPSAAGAAGEEGILGLGDTLNHDNLTDVADLTDLQSQLRNAGEELAQAGTSSACRSLATFGRHTAIDSTGHHPALSTAQAATLVTDEETLAAGVGC